MRPEHKTSPLKAAWMVVFIIGAIIYFVVAGVIERLRGVKVEKFVPPPIPPNIEKA